MKYLCLIPMFLFFSFGCSTIETQAKEEKEIKTKEQIDVTQYPNNIYLQNKKIKIEDNGYVNFYQNEGNIFYINGQTNCLIFKAKLIRNSPKEFTSIKIDYNIFETCKSTELYKKSIETIKKIEHFSIIRDKENLTLIGL